jgi:hypothetical protein
MADGGKTTDTTEDDWAEDYARVEQYEATGRSLPARDAMEAFRAAVEARHSRR